MEIEQNSDTEKRPRKLNEVAIAGQLTAVVPASRGLPDYCLLDFDRDGVFLIVRNLVYANRVALVPVFVDGASRDDFPDPLAGEPVFISIEGVLLDRFYSRPGSIERDRVYFVLCTRYFESAENLCENSVRLVGRIAGAPVPRPSKTFGGYSVNAIDREAIEEDFTRMKQDIAELPSAEKGIARRAVKTLEAMKLRDTFNDDDDFRYLKYNYGNYFDVAESTKLFINFHLAHTTDEEKGPLIRIAQLTSRADYKAKGYKDYREGDLVFVEGLLNSDFFEGHVPLIRLKVFVLDSGYRRKLPGR